MNAHLYTNNAGLRLITGFEGKPRLVARECEGGAWEVGYGNTFYEDGTPVKEGDTIPESRVVPLLSHVLQHTFEPGVRDLLKVEVSPNQFSALTSFAYNCGLEALAKSTLLRMVNLNRWEDAAVAFGMWIFATKGGHKQAYRGLLRRRYAEACLFLGYDWTVACSDDAIALQRKPPASLPGTDAVIYKTPFSDVLRVAYNYPLPSFEDDDFFEAINPQPELVLSPPSATVPDVAAAGQALPATQPAAPVPASPIPPPAKPSTVLTAGVGKEEVAPKVVATAPALPSPSPAKPQAPAPQAQQPTVQIANADIGKIRIENGAKVMETSDRAVAVGLKLGGIGIKTFCERRLLPTWVGSTYFEAVSDPVIVASITIGIVALWTWGHAMLVAGRRKRAKHAETATTLAY